VAVRVIHLSNTLFQGHRKYICILITWLVPSVFFGITSPLLGNTNVDLCNLQTLFGVNYQAFLRALVTFYATIYVGIVLLYLFTLRSLRKHMQSLQISSSNSDVCANRCQSNIQMKQLNTISSSPSASACIKTTSTSDLRGSDRDRHVSPLVVETMLTAHDQVNNSKSGSGILQPIASHHLVSHAGGATLIVQGSDTDRLFGNSVSLLRTPVSGQPLTLEPGQAGDTSADNTGLNTFEPAVSDRIVASGIVPHEINLRESTLKSTASQYVLLPMAVEAERKSAKSSIASLASAIVSHCRQYKPTFTSKFEKRATVTVGLIVLILSVCLIPLLVTLGLEAWVPEFMVTRSLRNYMAYLAVLNSFFNPLLYCFRVKEFRCSFLPPAQSRR
jgi:hypothetical protein